jgi:putative phosphonate transport system ATP-binding protein
VSGCEQPLLCASDLCKAFGPIQACRGISIALFSGEVLGVVGESGSGKTTLLNCLSGQIERTSGSISYDMRERGLVDLAVLSEPERRLLRRTEWGVVYQEPRQGLRMNVSAGGNVGERLMAVGCRHYGQIREEAVSWFNQVELDAGRLDDLPEAFSVGMQQRLQIARTLVTKPRLVFMDEPTGGLDVSVQARLLDLLRGLVRDLRIAAVVVTHDLAVARLLCDRLMVMRQGRVVEEGLTDQVLDDPQHPYTQLLVTSVMRA